MRGHFSVLTSRLRRVLGIVLADRRAGAMSFVLVFGLAGVMYLTLSHAATPTVSIEAEDSLSTGQATPITDLSASGGSAVRFTSQAGLQKWRASALVGGGYVNSIAYSPTDDPSNVNSLHVVVVTDVSGIFYSENGGASWSPANSAATGGNHLRAASVLWHPTTPGLVFVLLGDCTQGTGGLVKSADYGKTWAFTSTTPTGCGNQVPNNLGLPKPQPRHIGRLMGIDATNGYIYVGTFDRGVMRASLNNLGSWTTVGLGPNTSGATNFYIRGLTVDDSDPTVVYAATYDGSGNDGDGRIWRIKAANTASPVVESMTGSPVDTEDVFSLGGNLYATAASDTGSGVYRLGSAKTAATSSVFKKLVGPDYTSRACNATTYPDNCTIWFSVNGYVSGGTTTLWVGASNPPTIGGTYKTFWKATSTSGFSTDDGTWASYPTAKSSVINDIIGYQTTWWKWNEGTWAIPGYEGTYDIGDIAVGTNASHPILVAGQVGIWRSTDGGTNWYPAIEGFLNLVNREVVADPNVAGKVYQTNVDYRMFESDDYMRNIRVSRPATGSSQDGWSLAVDGSTSPSTLYLGLGDRDANTGGQIWQRSSGGTWTQIDAGAFGGLRPTGLGVTKDTNNNTVLIAAVQESGIWRKVGSGAWSQVAIANTSNGRSIMKNQNTNRADVQIRSGSSTFYVYDRDSGLWRGDNYGTNWTRIYASPTTSESEGEGYMRVHPSDPKVVFVSNPNGIHRITNADTAAADGATAVKISGALANVGAMTLGPNSQLIFVTQPSGTARPRIYTGDYSQSTPTWTDLSDDYYRSYAIKVITVAASIDGKIYVSTNNNASIVLD